MYWKYLGSVLCGVAFTVFHAVLDLGDKDKEGRYFVCCCGEKLLLLTKRT